jgi:hypothetical protein
MAPDAHSTLLSGPLPHISSSPSRRKAGWIDPVCWPAHPGFRQTRCETALILLVSPNLAAKESKDESFSVAEIMRQVKADPLRGEFEKRG